MWIKTGALALALLLAGVGGALVYGARRWRTTTEGFVARLNGSRLAPHNLRYDEKETDGLPGPVTRYFRTVLRNGQPLVVGARLTQEGEFRRGVADDSWMPFVATQVFRSLPPGFVWDARMRMAPGLYVHVRDGYLDGAGSMRGEVLGVVPLLDVHGMPEMAAGALQRYLAEAVWFPTALLPGQGVEWSPIDESTALATLRDKETTVSLEFRFGAEGEIASAYTTSRYREVKGAFVPTPWGGRYAGYAERGGMRIPLEAEVEWHLADSRLPYWRGRIAEVAYEYAR